MKHLTWADINFPPLNLWSLPSANYKNFNLDDGVGGFDSNKPVMDNSVGTCGKSSKNEIINDRPL